jgi:hypothetical protein
LSALALENSRDEKIFISNISVRIFPNELTSEVQFVLDCTLILRKFNRQTGNIPPEDFTLGRLEFVEVELHTLQSLFREFSQGKGIKINLYLD